MWRSKVKVRNREHQSVRFHDLNPTKNLLIFSHLKLIKNKSSYMQISHTQSDTLLSILSTYVLIYCCFKNQLYKDCEIELRPCYMRQFRFFLQLATQQTLHCQLPKNSRVTAHFCKLQCTNMLRCKLTEK